MNIDNKTALTLYSWRFSTSGSFLTTITVPFIILISVLSLSSSHRSRASRLSWTDWESARALRSSRILSASSPSSSWYRLTTSSELNKMQLLHLAIQNLILLSTKKVLYIWICTCTCTISDTCIIYPTLYMLFCETSVWSCLKQKSKWKYIIYIMKHNGNHCSL